MITVNLLFSAVLPILFSVIFSLAENKTKFGKLPYFLKQIIIGLVFGGISVLSTYLGTDIGGAAINVRDAFPIAAGLIFGGPAGIIAGLIGGIHRYFISFFGFGIYTQLACSLATAFSGIFAAVIRKLIFSNKIPTIFYSFTIAVTVEVFHMLLIFLTHMSDITTAFEYVQKCAVIMIILNSISSASSVFAVFLLNKNTKSIKGKNKTIAQHFQTSLLFCVIIAFLSTSLFTYAIQTKITDSNTEHLLDINLEDAADSISSLYNKQLTQSEIDIRLKNLSNDWHIGENGCIILFDNSGNIISDRDGHNEKSDININNYNKDIIFTADIHGNPSYCKMNEINKYYILVSLPINEAIYSKNISLYITVFMELIVFSFVLINLFILIKKHTVDKISQINVSLSKITDGNLGEKVNVRSNLEFSELSDGINKTVDTLKRYIKEADERVSKELELARQIQHSALPSVFPPFPNRKDFDIYADMFTAREVGGDFYDFYLIGKDKIVFTIADVSGKGIPAAMFMMNAKTLIKGLVESGIDVAEAFSKANNKLLENNNTGMFVTMWLGIFDTKTQTLQYVNAGHNPPLIKRNNGKFRYLNSKPNFILSGIENIKYKKEKIQLSPGDEIFLYTDGVTEAANQNNEFFGEARLLESLNEKSLSVEKLCKKVKKDVDKFVSGTEQSDDITMLAFKLNFTENKNSLSIIPEKATFETVFSFIDKQIEDFGIEKTISDKIRIAVDEIYSNIVNYSGATNAKIVINNNEKQTILTFSDNGVRFNPLLTKNPDTSLNSSERDIGGLGIFLVKKLSTSVNYSYKDGMNVLNVVFS